MQTPSPPPFALATSALRARAARAGGAMLLILLMSACSSTFGELPSAIGGLPEGTPERPVSPAAYPAVHDMPAPRSAVLTADEQKKAAAELAAAREQQNKRATSAAQQD